MIIFVMQIVTNAVLKELLETTLMTTIPILTVIYAVKNAKLSFTFPVMSTATARSTTKTLRFSVSI